jgi:hypothetical protein
MTKKYPGDPNHRYRRIRDPSSGSYYVQCIEHIIGPVGQREYCPFRKRADHFSAEVKNNKIHNCTFSSTGAGEMLETKIDSFLVDKDNVIFQRKQTSETDLIRELACVVAKHNMSMDSVLSDAFTNLIRHAIILGQTFPEISADQLFHKQTRDRFRAVFINVANEAQRSALKLFVQFPFTSIAIDEGTTKRRKMLDFVLECSYHKDTVSLPVHIETMQGLKATDYAPASINGLKEISKFGVQVSSVVIDGGLAQLKAFNEEWHESVRCKYPPSRGIFLFPCLAHRVHNSYVYTVSKFPEAKYFSEWLINSSTILISNHLKIGARCPSHVATRWLYHFEICDFIKKHSEAVAEFINLPNEIEMLYKILTVLKALVLIFEDPKTQNGSAYALLEKAIYALEELGEVFPLAIEFTKTQSKYTSRSNDGQLWLFTYCLTVKGHDDLKNRIIHPDAVVTNRGFLKDFYIKDQKRDDSEVLDILDETVKATITEELAEQDLTEMAPSAIETSLNLENPEASNDGDLPIKFMYSHDNRPLCTKLENEFQMLLS